MDAPAVCRIKKYPNRRFYDTTRSRHVTLDELYELVRAGQSIQVTDSQSGADITSLVLTHMILEREAPKLDLFPAGLLHQVIQTNQQILHSFVERYFSGALNAFLASQQEFGSFLRRAGLPASGLPTPWQWAQSFMGGSKPNGSVEPEPEAAAPPSDGAAISELREQLAEVSSRLADLQTQQSGTGEKPRKKKRRKS